MGWMESILWFFNGSKMTISRGGSGWNGLKITGSG